MKKINPYLSFNGNCREAMRFYQRCLGGELHLQPVEDSPLSEQLPAAMRKKILHATLRSEKILLMGTDLVGEQGLIKGNSVSLLIDCSSEAETREFYRKLSHGGTSTHPLHTSFWGALFGDLTDKYGHQWLLHFDKRHTGQPG